MRGPLLLYCLLMSLLLIITGLSPAISGSQIWLLAAGVPLMLYFSFQILKYLALRSRRAKGELMDPEEDLVPINVNQHVHYHYHEAKKIEPKPEPQVALAPVRHGVSDLDRRQFLKLIGSAGMAVFLLQLFSGKANAAFFGSVPGPGVIGIKDSAGNLIDPAEKYPTDAYKIAQIDDIGPTYNYFGFLDKTGAWYIQRETASGGSAGDYRYVKGASTFSTNWTNRASLTYDTFDNVF